MTDTLSSTMVPGRCDGTERLDPPFLDGKLQIPRPGFPLLPRRRVHALLDRATRHRVTLVSGPPGAGKTVACASWAALRPAAGRVIWLTVDPADRRDWFWAYVCACVTRIRPAPPEVLQSLEDTGPDGFPMRLVETAQAFTEPLVLVLDDVHEATDPGVLNGLDVLIRHAPPTLRLVLAARRPPALQLARLRVCGELGDIGAADLACTAEEAEAYFAMLGMRLPAAERDRILRRTEGWMAGIRLAALQAERSAGPAGDAAGGETGPGPLVTEYVWDEVLGRQKPRTRAFLARTSVVAELSGDLADAICAQTGGEATLARLSRENCLVDAVDGAPGGYRYHPLLREVLGAELNREFPGELPVLLGRAARWYAEQDRALDAVRAACAARDWDQAAGVLAGSAVGILMSDGARPLESVLGLFPADRAGEAAVAAAWAGARLWSADADGAAAYLEAAARSVERAAADIRRVVEPVLAALRILRAAEQRHGDPALIRCGWALVSQAQQSAATSAEHRSAGLLWFALGCASLHCWDIAAAARALRHADRQLSTGGLDLLRARARAWRALALACAGELTAAGHAADEVRTRVIPATPETATLAALGGAQLNLARDDLLTAQRLLDEADGDRAGHVPGEPPVAAIRALIQARVLLADGAPAAAAAALARLREGPPPGCAGLSGAAIAAEVDIALRAGDLGRARALLPPGEAGPCRGELALARAGLLLAEGDFAAARDAAAACLDGAAALTLHERTRALLAAAVAARRLGDAELAATQIGEALGLAEPEGAYRAFLDGGLAVRSAVTVLVPPTSRYAGFVGRLLERFDGCGPRLAGAAGRAGVRLTDSEHAVLRFLPSHMTNEEISEALFLSVNTVKTHLRSAYKKLGVRSRRDAIARGRRLGLLLPRPSAAGQLYDRLGRRARHAHRGRALAAAARCGLAWPMASERDCRRCGEEPMSDRVPPEFASWSLAWAEEFNGPAGSLADPRTWRPETGGGGWGNSELQYYTSEPANAALDGAGSLAITVARPDPQLAQARYDGCQYTSARLITKNLRSFRYGLIQARIKLPAGHGIWPAFWMLGTNIDTAGWPGCGEIDVMENFGANPAAVHGTIHGPGYSGDGGITASLDTGSPLAAGFHVYSVCWESDKIRWYVDQRLYHTVTPADLGGNRWVFDHDFYLLLNVTVGGRLSQRPDRSTAFPQTMLIDYTRVYLA